MTPPSSFEDMAVQKGLARDFLTSVIESEHVLLLSNEILYEFAKVLRYPRMLAIHGLSEKRIYYYTYAKPPRS